MYLVTYILGVSIGSALPNLRIYGQILQCIIWDSMKWLICTCSESDIILSVIIVKVQSKYDL